MEIVTEEIPIEPTEVVDSVRFLDILVPQYKETEEVIKPLLDSIAIQQLIDLSIIKVIIANDGSDVILSDEFLNSYNFEIEYLKLEHAGVSATRQALMDAAAADYIMFCDADDMFYSVLAFASILGEVMNTPFAYLSCDFLEQVIINGQNQLVPHTGDVSFVHGKVLNRQYLYDNNIHWNKDLLVHEDSFFNFIAFQHASRDGLFRTFTNPIYFWKWRDDSVCRTDVDFLVKTYDDVLRTCQCVLKEYIDRGFMQQAVTFATDTFLYEYYVFNKDEWYLEENKEYKDKAYAIMKEIYDKYFDLYLQSSLEEKLNLAKQNRNKVFDEGMLFEHQTFDEWIEELKNLPPTIEEV